MNEQKPQPVKRVKQPNLKKLERMSDAELEQRIAEASAKIQKKRAKLQAQIETLNEKLKEYASYKAADVEACKKLLADRKKGATNQSKKAA